MKEVDFMTTISTIIPVYQDSGLPFETLKETIISILSQTRAPIEIILSDDSSGNAVEDWVHEFNRTSPVPLTYLRNPGPRGVSSNSNFASKHAQGELLHFLHSDDHIVGIEVYGEVFTIFEETSCPWLLLGGRMNGIITIPSLADLNLFGVNTVGGPSGLIVKKSIFEGFDENISLLMDIEYFLRTWKKHGTPVISNMVSINYGSGNWQLTKTIDEEKHSRELLYLWGNLQLLYADFNNLMNTPDCWDVKKIAYNFLTSDVRLGVVRKCRVILFYNYASQKFKFLSISKRLIQRIIH